MRQQVTKAIILSRTDYGEAARILTVLTPDYGKLALLAKGVRRVKSKLAGGIELFSVSEITFIKGRGEVGTLVSARLVTHYEKIVHDVSRTMAGYDLIKQLHKATEDEPERGYFDVLQAAFLALQDHDIPLELIQVWFAAQILRLSGHVPNLQTDNEGRALQAGHAYGFDFEHMACAVAPAGQGQLGAGHIKFMRLLFADNSPYALSRVQGQRSLSKDLQPLMRTMLVTFIRV